MLRLNSNRSPVRFFVLLALLCMSQLLYANATQIKLEQVASDFNIPWGMAFLTADKLLITERSGGVYLLDITSGKRVLLKNTPAVVANNQGGMLDVAIPHHIAHNNWIYFTYVKASSENYSANSSTVLARARLKDDRFYDWQALLVTTAASSGYHFGSRIAFDEHHVFFGLGDRGNRSSAQNLNNHMGSIFRLYLDGRIPEDNPFVGNKDVKAEIWSYGHRNPQGLAYDFSRQRLWEIEHGPRGGDEINLIEPAKNYGWPVISYGMEYTEDKAVGEATHKEGMQQPVKVYIPSIAPGSLLLYTGKAFPQWQGNLFAGALKLRHLNRVVLDQQGAAVSEERLFESLNQRIRALVQSPQGWIYFSTDNGSIYRIRPEN